MIKVQDFQDDLHYCLNPYCFHSEEREFDNNHRHLSVQQCSKWIIRLRDLIQYQPIPFSLKQLEGMDINFEQHPLKACRKLQNLSISDWKKWLKTEENRMKKDVISALEVQFQAITIKIEELISQSSFLSDLANIVPSSQTTSSAINDYYSKKKPLLEELTNVVLFKKNELKDRTRTIKLEIAKIFPSMMEDSNVKVEVLAHQEQRAYHQFMFQHGENSYNKLQVIASALGKKVSPYSMERQRISLQCLLCPRTAKHMVQPSDKKNTKKFVAEQILTHLYCSHYQQIGFAFSRKIVKSYRQCRSFQMFLEESKKYHKVRLVDRQSGVTFEQNYEDYKSNKDSYTVEVVSIQNEHMAKGKHILVNVCQSIDLMLAIISYACSQRDQEIEIISKKEALKLGIRELLDLKAPMKKEEIPPAVKEEEK